MIIRVNGEIIRLKRVIIRVMIRLKKTVVKQVFTSHIENTVGFGTRVSYLISLHVVFIIAITIVHADYKTLVFEPFSCTLSFSSCDAVNTPNINLGLQKVFDAVNRSVQVMSLQPSRVCKTLSIAPFDLALVPLRALVISLVMFWI